MEFKRKRVIDLYLEGNAQIDIVKALQPLKVNKSFVSRTIARYRDTGSIAKRYGGGRKKSATSTEMVRKIKEQIEQNPTRSGNKLAEELKISARSVQRILKNDLELKYFKIQEAQDLTMHRNRIVIEGGNDDGDDSGEADAETVATTTTTTTEVAVDADADAEA